MAEGDVTKVESMEDLFKDSLPATSEASSKSEAEPEAKEEAKEEVKEIVKDEHHEEWLRLVANMNELAAGRSEQDIPLNDDYWDARNLVQAHQSRK